MCSHTLSLIFIIALRAGATDPHWEKFKAQHNKQYKDAADEQARYKLFLESKDRVEKLNKLNGHPAFGINFMSDRYESEKHTKGLLKPKGFKSTAPVKNLTATMRSPASINWRWSKAVTPVKNQGQCGCCWAFSAAEAIESQMILALGGKYDFTLSPQQICSCSREPGDNGCDGGFTTTAFDYVKSAPGLANGFYIPYEQSLTEKENAKACPTSKVSQMTKEWHLTGIYAEVSGYSYAVPPCSDACAHQDLKGLAAALEQTPLSIIVNAGTWDDYTGDVVMSSACGSMAFDSLDHAVMVVGFNTTAPIPYWIVRNSWATTWGDQGYIYLEMGKNTCGLANVATIPEVIVHQSRTEAAEAAIHREALYQMATQGGWPVDPACLARHAKYV